MAGGAEQFQAQGAAALEDLLDNEEATQEDIIANVEIMLKSETRKNEQLKKAPSKAQQQDQGFDLNTGVLAPVKAAPVQTPAQKAQAAKAKADEPQLSLQEQLQQAQAKMKQPKEAQNQSLDTTATSQPVEEFGQGALDEELSIIKKKTIAVKVGNVQAAFVQNLDAIQESVNNFQKMKEDAGNDIIA
jgi:hypothetical protein